MSYSIKKKGVSFKLKIDTGADLAGAAAGFKAYVLKDADDTKTEVSGSFTESESTEGLYFSGDVTIPDAGDYTIVINNPDIGMDNHATPVVVVAATIDDVKTAIDDMRVVVDTIAVDVDGLNGQDLSDLKTNLAAVKALLDDEDGAAVNSVMEFVKQIDEAVAAGNASIGVLSGFTDDVENLLNGTEKLADGSDNPLYGANNADLKALIEGNLVEMKNSLSAAKDAIIAKVNEAKSAVLDSIAEVKTVVDANATELADAGYGLAALKGGLDTITTNIASNQTDILAIIEDGTKGLVGIYDTMVSRFDSVDTQLSTIDGKINAIGEARSFKAFV